MTSPERKHSPTHKPAFPFGKAGLMLLAQLFGCYLLASLTLLCGFPINRAILPLALIGGWAAVCSSAATRVKFLLAIVAIAAWGMAMALGAVLWDFSYDGNAYHQEIIAALCEGWNPTREQPQFSDLSLWSLHYAKGLEIIEATVSALTGNLESGKAVNFILALCSGLMLLSFLRRYFPTISKRTLTAVTLLAVCNPVFITQAPTFYIDYAKYFYTLITIMALVDAAGSSHKFRGLAILAMVITLAIATKFNAFFEEGLVIGAGLIWLIVRRRGKSAGVITLTALAATIVGVLLLGYHPYVTNTLSAGHPLYPLMGSGSKDIMTSNTPIIYADSNRFANFFASMTYPLLPRYDSRSGGFGPLFMIMLLISIVALWRSRTQYRALSLYIAAATVLSCFIFRQSWWARYICQAWLIFPLAALMAAYSHSQRHATAWLMGCGAFTLLICLPSYGATLRLRAYRNAIFTSLRGQTVEVQYLNRAYSRQMAEHGIRAVEYVGPLTDSLLPLPYYGTLNKPGAYPVMLLSPENHRKILDELAQSPFSKPLD